MTGIVLVLDAMGVIYQAGDDVGELLVPFVLEHGGVSDSETIERSYTRASLGEITADEFWDSVGLSQELEDAYLARHQLSKGLEEFLRSLPASVESLWCLSNDVGPWSRKLRDEFELTQFFAGFVISSEVKSRKPDKEIYAALLRQAKCEPQECLFVDDRQKNLDAAEGLGFRTVEFGFGTTARGAHPNVASLDQLREYLQ